jgi:hypothetical protein
MELDTQPPQKTPLYPSKHLLCLHIIHKVDLEVIYVALHGLHFFLRGSVRPPPHIFGTMSVPLTMFPLTMFPLTMFSLTMIPLTTFPLKIG